MFQKDPAQTGDSQTESVSDVQLRMAARLVRSLGRPVLIVEDGRENQVLLGALCAELRVPWVVAENGQVALDLADTQEFAAFIVDLLLPVMDGQTFLREIRRRRPDAIVIIQTALDATDTIIDVMKGGAFDYLVKPIDDVQFRRALLRALEFRYLRDLEISLEKHAGTMLRGQLDWLLRNESARATPSARMERAALSHLKTALSQGEGLGAMVILVDMIRQNARREGAAYRVDAELTQLLYTNNQRTRAVLAGLDAVVQIMNATFHYEESSVFALSRRLRASLANLQPLAELRRVRLMYADAREDRLLMIDTNQLTVAFEEIVINACKYAAPDTEVLIVSGFADGFFSIAVKNSVLAGEGISAAEQRLVLEPFFRLRPPVEEAAAYEKFTLGLGLTAVDYIVKKNSGLFFIHEMREERDDGAAAVLAELFLPISNRSAPQ